MGMESYRCSAHSIRSQCQSICEFVACVCVRPNCKQPMWSTQMCDRHLAHGAVSMRVDRVGRENVLDPCTTNLSITIPKFSELFLWCQSFVYSINSTNFHLVDFIFHTNLTPRWIVPISPHPLPSVWANVDAGLATAEYQLSFASQTSSSPNRQWFERVNRPNPLSLVHQITVDDLLNQTLDICVWGSVGTNLFGQNNHVRVISPSVINRSFLRQPIQCSLNSIVFAFIWSRCANILVLHGRSHLERTLDF